MDIKINSYVDTTDITEVDAIVNAKAMVSIVDGLSTNLLTKLYYIIPKLGKILVVVSDEDRDVLGVESNVLANKLIESYQLDNIPASVIDYKELIIKKGSIMTDTEIFDVAQFLVDSSTTGIPENKLTVAKIINYNTNEVMGLVMPSVYTSTFTSIGTLVNDGDAINGDDIVATGGVTTIDLDVFMKLNTADTITGDYFGYSVAVSNTKIVIGAYGTRTSHGADAGVAYIYDLDGTNEIKIEASDGDVSDYFGISVDVSDTHIVVGAKWGDDNGKDSGCAYLYDIDGTNEIKLVPSDGAAGDIAGLSVGVSNTKVIVSASFNDVKSGAAYIYDLDGTNEIKLTSSDGADGDNFGHSVAISDTKIVVGAYGDDDNASTSGSAYIFDLDGTNEIKVLPSDGEGGDYFGISVGISDTRIVVGAYGDDDGGSSSGSAYVFNLDGSNEVKLIASDGADNDRYGNNVDISDTKVIVGAYRNDALAVYSGAAYVYDIDGANETKLIPADGAYEDYFGISVGIANTKIVIGAYEDDDNGSNSGSAYTYG